MSTEDLHDTPDDNAGYKFVAPAQKKLDDILAADQDDASLQK